MELFASYRDGHRHQDILASVGQGSVIEIMIYADGLDRDMMGHTSGRNKIHLTYVLILNLTVGRPRSADDYHLLQVKGFVTHFVIPDILKNDKVLELDRLNFKF